MSLLVVVRRLLFGLLGQPFRRGANDFHDVKISKDLFRHISGSG